MANTEINNSKIGEWFAAGGMAAVISGIKNIWNKVAELDSALTDLKKTTDATEAELKAFCFTSNDTAKQIGVPTAEIINAAAAWSRLGYSIKDAAALAKNSAILASISPDLNIGQAVDGLSTSLKAFKIEAGDSLDGVISKINVIGNTKALNNGTIVDILTNSASAMAAGNNTLEQTIALGTAAAEITGNAGEAGNALKSVSMRIRGIDEDTGQFSESLDNLKETIYDLTGVSVMQDANTYKSTYDILKQISDVWNTLAGKAQAETLEALFGKEQTDAGNTILSNFDSAENAMVSMARSAGNAMEAMNGIFDSVDYKLNRLKETGVGIGQNLFGGDDMKASIDILNKFAEAVDFLTGKLGLFGTVRAGLGIGAFIQNLDWLKCRAAKIA